MFCYSFLIKETFTLNNLSPSLSVNSIGLFGSYLLCFVEVVEIKNVVLCILYRMHLIIFDCSVSNIKIKMNGGFWRSPCALSF